MSLSKEFIPVGKIPEALDSDEIVLVSGDLGVLSDISLSPGEQRRAEAMASDGARLRFTAARRLLRGTLSRWMEQEASEIEILPDEYGKPRLVDPTSGNEIQFSIAHSAHHVAVAFSRRKTGLDLENERPIDVRALSARFFSAEEAASVAEESDSSLFFRLWTCREAAIKADGRGLAKLMGVTNVLLDEGGKGDGEKIEVRIGSEIWSVIPWQSLRGGSGLSYGALAFREKPSLISWCELR
jgi:phosphopantetheinyl transferase